jgi:hypothetical protein
VLETANTTVESLYGRRYTLEKNLTDRIKTEQKKRLANQKNAMQAYKDLAKASVSAIGKATWDAWTVSDKALEQEGRSREQHVKKILKDESLSLAKQAFQRSLWEGAQALGMAALGRYDAAAQHGIAAAAYGSVAAIAGITASQITDVGGGGGDESSDPSSAISDQQTVAGVGAVGTGQTVIINFPHGFYIGDKTTMAKQMNWVMDDARARGVM